MFHIHDIAATLGEKGFPREPLKIIEICNARYAHEVLQKDIATALMLPCPVSVYVERGTTCISTMLPRMIADLFPGKDLDKIAGEVERAVIKIVDSAAQ